jgi:hypothetical protein
MASRLRGSSRCAVLAAAVVAVATACERRNVETRDVDVLTGHAETASHLSDARAVQLAVLEVLSGRSHEDMGKLITADIRVLDLRSTMDGDTRRGPPGRVETGFFEITAETPQLHLTPVSTIARDSVVTYSEDLVAIEWIHTNGDMSRVVARRTGSGWRVAQVVVTSPSM